MRYQIAKYECPELYEKQCLAEKSVSAAQKLRDVTGPNEFTHRAKENNFVYVCKHCGAELYGYFQYSDCYAGGHDAEWAKDAYLSSIFHTYDSSDERQQKINTLDRAIRHTKEALELAKTVEKEAIAAYEKAVNIKVCPICGEPLSQEKGFFLPDVDLFFPTSRFNWEKKKEALMQQFGVEPFHLDTYFQKFDAIMPLREPTDRAHAKEEVAVYAKGCDLYVAEKESATVSEIKTNSDQLKKYILHLIHLENNIYAVEQQLSELYYQRVHNNRSVVLSVHEPAYMIKAELEELRAAYQKAVEAIGDAEAYQPEISVDYPVEPTAPILGKPGLFNKKKVLEENAALTAKYQAEMEAYQNEVQRCDDEKARLIAEKRTAVLAEAQTKADAAKAALDEAERGMDDKIKAVEARPIPAKAVKEVLDKEIAEAEDLLKKTFAARNELYAFDIIFGKYRNAVALSSFYEYLMSGRCTSLEGADGAYNIYESEIRANRVIAQLDTVISSLEDIKQNQYMMYEELCSINSSLDSLNYTMDAALKSIRGIEANTNHMSEYMEHISKNSDVIAHNTAVTAYYSKVNAQLTNALGYMVAFN